MSDIGGLRSVPDLDFTDLRFPDLIGRLEEILSSVRATPDIESVLKSVNGQIRNKTLSVDQINDLKKLRQKAYDKKRVLKSPDRNIVQLPDMVRVQKTPAPISVIEKTKKERPQIRPRFTPQICREYGFWKSIWKTLSSLDGEKFIKRFPSTIALLIISSSITYLVWLQSLELYQTSGLGSPKLAATGALFMVVGFSIFHSLTKNFFSIMLCAYIGCYEVYFMVSGTLQNEEFQIQRKYLESEKMSLLKQKVEKTHKNYTEILSRYEDPKSKVYKNLWFKAKYLNPSWSEKEEAVNELSIFESKYSDQKSLNHSVLLKIFYRLGLILLTMVFSHKLISIFK